MPGGRRLTWGESIASVVDEWPELQRLDSPAREEVAEEFLRSKVERRLDICMTLMFLTFAPLLAFATYSIAAMIPTVRTIASSVAFGSFVLAMPSSTLLARHLCRRWRRRILFRLLQGRGLPLCAACGFDCRGQLDKRCPECGAALPEAVQLSPEFASKEGAAREAALRERWMTRKQELLKVWAVERTWPAIIRLDYDDQRVIAAAMLRAPAWRRICQLCVVEPLSVFISVIGGMITALLSRSLLLGVALLAIGGLTTFSVIRVRRSALRRLVREELARAGITQCHACGRCSRKNGAPCCARTGAPRS